MAERPRIALFCDDWGHEAFARALIHRVAREAHQRRPDLQVVSSRGGQGRALNALKSWQRLLNDGQPSGVGVLVVLVDADDAGWIRRRRDVTEILDGTLVPRAVIGCPDPHIEAWMAADHDAFQRAFGARPLPQPAADLQGREARRAYKHWLESSLREAGVELLTSAMSTAPELVAEMDLFKAGKAAPSLKAFVDDLTRALHPR